MTSEKLAEFRAKGMLLDPKFDRLAVIGDKKKEKEEDKIKSLSIKFVSCSSDDENFNLTFEVSATNLKSNKAKIFVEEMNASNETAIPKTNVEINANGKKNITVSFSKDKEFDKYIWQDGFVYQATITCDGESAETEEFELKCTKIVIPKQKTCFCNRDFTVDEFKDIVIELRKQEIYIKNGRLIKDSKGKPILKNKKKQFEDITMYDELGEKLFNLDYTEKIRQEDANFKKFTEAINKTLNDYEINTCIRKIHFLAQCYHETQRFTLTYEKSPNSNVSGGSFYRGRGLIQLTHDYNYEKLKKKLSDNSKITDFVPKVATEINLACQASGYFWKNIGAKTGNINQYADKDDVLTVSKEINGYVAVPNGFNDRKLFTENLKKIMKYDQCKNKK